MTKKALALLLALALLVCAAPLVCARPADDGWLIYYAKTEKNAFDAIVVAPAKYTRVSDRPQIEIIPADGKDESSVQTPAAEQIRFYFGGKTETRWILTVTCAAADARIAVLPGSVLDDAGNSNTRIWFDDEVDYMPAEGWIEIDVYSGLLQCDYSRSDETVAVGDTLRVDYSGLYPIEIFVNGERAASLPGGEQERFTCKITEPGALRVAVCQNGGEIETRPLTVVTSKEMYKRNLRDGLITDEDIPTVKDLVEVGVPLGSPFIPVAIAVAFLVALKDFFHRMFSFLRIEK